MTKALSDDDRELIAALVRGLETWIQGRHFRLDYDDDGDGYLDYSGLRVTHVGRAMLEQIVLAHGRDR